MTHMDASSLRPDESKELAELRRRAYGTAAGIANDPAAQARLEELENANRAQPVVPDVPQSDATQAPAADDSPSIPPASLASGSHSEHSGILVPSPMARDCGDRRHRGARGRGGHRVRTVSRVR